MTKQYGETCEKIHDSQIVITIEPDGKVTANETNPHWDALRSTGLINKLTSRFPWKLIQVFAEVSPSQEATKSTLRIFRILVEGKELHISSLNLTSQSPQDFPHI